MKKIWYNLLLAHSRITFDALVSKSKTNVTELTGNPAFATPVPSLATFTAAIDRLVTAVAAYDYSRSRQDKLERDLAFADLKALRAELGAYVQSISAGDPELIVSAGFEEEKVPQPLGELPAPLNVLAMARPYPGSIEVKFSGVKGRLSYQAYICSGDPKVEADWSLVATTGKTRVIINGLESDRVYFFRVAALGATGLSPMSDSASAKAA